MLSQKLSAHLSFSSNWDNEGEDKPEPAKLSMQQRQELLLTTLKKDGGLDRLKRMAA